MNYAPSFCTVLGPCYSKAGNGFVPKDVPSPGFPSAQGQTPRQGRGPTGSWARCTYCSDWVRGSEDARPASLSGCGKPTCLHEQRSDGLVEGHHGAVRSWCPHPGSPAHSGLSCSCTVSLQLSGRVVRLRQGWEEPHPRPHSPSPPRLHSVWEAQGHAAPIRACRWLLRHMCNHSDIFHSHQKAERARLTTSGGQIHTIWCVHAVGCCSHGSMFQQGWTTIMLSSGKEATHKATHHLIPFR